MMESENIKATATKAAAPRPAASATPAAPAENELKPAFFAPDRKSTRLNSSH